MKKNKYVRLIDKLWEDCIFPGYAGMPVTDKRHKAIVEILCRIPEADYQLLVSMIDDFHWFVPGYNGRPNYADVYPFTRNTDDELGKLTIKGYARVLFLSPCMERLSFSNNIAIIGHEVARIVLKHNLFPGMEFPEQEQAAWERVKEWGFGFEVETNAKRLKDCAAQ
jgi:hypothetical protein